MLSNYNYQEALFQKGQLLSIKVRSLGGIIQNEGGDYTLNEINEWMNIANNAKRDLTKWIDDVNKFCLETMKNG
jgi:hypothetical protein